MKLFTKLLLSVFAVASALTASADITIWIRSAEAPKIRVWKTTTGNPYIKSDGTTTTDQDEALWTLNYNNGQDYAPNGDNLAPTKWWLAQVKTDGEIYFQITTDGTEEHSTATIGRYRSTNTGFTTVALEDGKTYYYIYNNGDPTFYLNVTEARTAASYVFFQPNLYNNDASWRKNTYLLDAYYTGKFDGIDGSLNDEILDKGWRAYSYKSTTHPYCDVYLLVSDREYTGKVTFLGRSLNSSSTGHRYKVQEYFEADYIKGGFYQPTERKEVNIEYDYYHRNALTPENAGKGACVTEAFANIVFPDELDVIVPHPKAYKSTINNDGQNHYTHHLTLENISHITPRHLPADLATAKLIFRRQPKVYYWDPVYGEWSNNYDNADIATVQITSHQIAGDGSVTIDYTVSYDNQVDADESLQKLSGSFTAASEDSPIDFGDFYIVDQFNSNDYTTDEYIYDTGFGYTVELYPHTVHQPQKEAIIEIKKAIVTPKTYVVEEYESVKADTKGRSNALHNSTSVYITPRLTHKDLLEWHGTTGGVTSIELLKNDVVVAKLLQNDQDHEKFDTYVKNEQDQWEAVGYQTSLYDNDYEPQLIMNLPNTSFGINDVLKMRINATTPAYPGGTQESVYNTFMINGQMPESFGYSFDIGYNTSIRSELAADSERNTAYAVSFTIGNNYNETVKTLADQWSYESENSAEVENALEFVLLWREPALYRIWRIEGNDTTFLNTLDDISFSFQRGQAPVSTNYSKLNEYTVTGEGSWIFVSVPASITINDHMIDKPLSQQPNNVKTIKYLARVYLPAARIPWSAPRRAQTPAEPIIEDRYAVFERSIEVEINEEVITAVDVTPAAKVPVSVSYTNLAGQSGNTLFHGMNIVTTRYSDGTTSVSKVIK